MLTTVITSVLRKEVSESQNTALPSNQYLTIPTQCNGCGQTACEQSAWQVATPVPAKMTSVMLLLSI